MFWTALTLLRPGGAADARMRPLFRGAVSLAALIFVMALSGGLVAGIRAGFAYNTFPLMNGHVVPPEIMQISPWYMNFVNNMATVQFDHRLLAWTLLVLVPIWWWRVRATPEVPARARFAAHLLLAMLLAQVSLGISTLLLVVPLLDVDPNTNKTYWNELPLDPTKKALRLVVAECTFPYLTHQGLSDAQKPA